MSRRLQPWRTTVHLRADQARALATAAGSSGRPQAEILRAALDDHLGLADVPAPPPPEVDDAVTIQAQRVGERRARLDLLAALGAAVEAVATARDVATALGDVAVSADVYAAATGSSHRVAGATAAAMARLRRMAT